MQFKECYQNPFIEERADPYITLGPDGFYYFTASYPMKSADDKDGYDRVILRRAKDISELASAEEITIWKVADTTLTHRFIWAPELHYIAGLWYVFYAGSEDKENNWHLTATFLSATAMIHIPELGVKRENSKRGKRMIFLSPDFPWI